jgi:integrase
MVLDGAVDDRIIPRNVARGVKGPKVVRDEVAYFAPEQVDALAEVIAPPYDALVRIMGTLGLRWSEAVALRRQSVDLLRRRLRVDVSLENDGAPDKDTCNAQRPTIARVRGDA